MATVPSASNFRVSPSVGGAQFNVGASPGEIGGRQTEQLGSAVMGAGSAAADIALDMQRTVDQVKVNDALNQARGVVNNLTFDPQIGYKSQRGESALSREGGQALPEEFASKLQTRLASISGSVLQTEQQRRMFQQHAGSMAESFRGDVEQHMLHEFTAYRVSTNDGTIDLAGDDAKRNWNDPSKVVPALDAAKAAIYDKGQALGWAPSQVQAAMLTATSGVHRSVVMTALENNNPTYALGYLDKFKSQMSADDILRVQGHVNQQVWAEQSMQAVEGATRAAQPAIAPNNFDRMVNITLQSESRGQRFGADGKTLLASAAGAQGEMQVMPATAKNPGYGIKPAQPGNPDDLARVGREYLQAMLQQYGDPAKAWAAYNAGPARLDQALAESAKGRSGSPDWLSYMPKETQAYVAKNVQAMGTATAGAPPRPVEADFVAAALGKLPPGAAPQVVKMTREQAVQQFGIINKTLNEQGDNALADAQRWAAQNPGQIDRLPASLRDPLIRYAPGKLDDLVKYDRTLAKGENISDLVLYNRLAAHPDELGQLSDTQFEMLRPNLSIADFKHFANERSNYLNGTTDTSAGGLNTKAFNTEFNARLEALQLPVSAKPTDKVTLEQIGARQQFARNFLFQQQQQAGKKFTQAEIAEQLDNLFAKDVTFKTQLFGIGMGLRETVPLMSLNTINDLPDGAAEQIKARLIKEGRAAPTNTDILNRYRAVRSYAKP